MFRRLLAIATLLPSLALAACSGGGTSGPTTPPVAGAPGATTLGAAAHTAAAATSAASSAGTEGASSSILAGLHAIATIGSTVDPISGDQNPYGLTTAPITKGLLSAGDLVVCNFNDRANVQGNGTSVIALHPVAGSTPTHIDADARLLGCDALALSAGDGIWAAAYGANDNPIVSSTGTFLTALLGGPWHGPWGQAYSTTPGPYGPGGAFFESNALDGSIVRINLGNKGGFTYDTIATGFPVNGGVPGSILAPSGLTYDKSHDRLYVVDGADNSVTALDNVASIPAGGVVVKGGSFGGSAAASARRVFAGRPLNGPISAALLPNGNLVVGNTLDRNGKNLLIELTPSGEVLAKKNVDKGAAGAIFGITVATSGTGATAQTTIYFNDDNDNTVKALTAGTGDVEAEDD